MKFVGHGKPSSLYFPSQTDTIETGTVPLFRKFVNKDKCHLHLVLFHPFSSLTVDPGVLHIMAYAGTLRPKWLPFSEFTFFSESRVPKAAKEL